MNKLNLSLGVFALGLMFASSPVFAQSSVSDDGGASNNLVSASASSAAAGAVGATIASSIGAAITPPPPSGSGGGGGVPAEQGNLNTNYKTASVFNYNTRKMTGKSAGRRPRAGLWVQGGYTLIDNDEAGGQFDGDAINVLVGLDYKPAKFNGKMVIGVAAGYEKIDIVTAFNDGTFEGDGFSITPYIGYQLGRN